MRTLLLFIGCWLLAACSTTNEIVLANYATDLEQKYPPVSLFLKQPSEELNKDCAAYDKLPLMRECKVNPIPLQQLVDEAQASGLFEETYYTNSNADYQLSITTTYYLGGKVSELGNAILSGLTLMTLPMKKQILIKTDSLLTWRGIPIAHLQQEIPYTSRTSLTSSSDDPYRNPAKSVISHILNELQGQQSFSEEVLVSKLNSTNYRQDLHLPDELVDFIFDSQTQFRHPFWGTQLRYVHNQFAFDYVDIFIYPVRDWRWDNTTEQLAAESQRVRKDIEFYADRDHFNQLQFNNERTLNLGSGSQARPVAAFDGILTNSAGERLLTHTYLFIKEDKFVKLRATFNITDNDTTPALDGVVAQLINEGVVPKESLFMSELRNKWRADAR
ncbi:hypothetical protein [Halioxenophilus sp. WMMB6]|uniref:hypothetical protein n=1 Tax=Halioxenophilus sp. WMMB6 TaxID=3073815 RepID=UPI00295F2251|nr:hypothetical protein [Halioxenophilus sp. WMMB6]